MVLRPYLPRNSLLHGLAPSIRLPSKPFPLLAIARDFVPLLREEAGHLLNITQSPKSPTIRFGFNPKF